MLQPDFRRLNCKGFLFVQDLAEVKDTKVYGRTGYYDSDCDPETRIRGHAELHIAVVSSVSASETPD